MYYIKKDKLDEGHFEGGTAVGTPGQTTKSLSKEYKKVEISMLKILTDPLFNLILWPFHLMADLCNVVLTPCHKR